jgi:hypothetical protein
MFDPLFARAGVLWSAIIDSIQSTDSMTTSLSSFSARQLTRSPQLDSGQRKLFVDRFAIEGEVDGKTPLEIFLATQPDLTLADRQLISSWRRSFVALVEIVQIFPNGLEVMNWLTAKHYRILFTDESSQAAMARLKVGEIIIAQLSPIRDIDWAILAPWVALGRLGRPKLAVAVGAFRQNYPHYLYSDAPASLAAAWESVAVYHDRFVEFFGSDEVTLSGTQLQTRIGEFQTWLVAKQLDSAGVDRSKSLAELATEAGLAEADLSALDATPEGTDPVTPKSQPQSLEQMVTPPVELPAHLKTATAVTALSHPYWGQMFLADYPQLVTVLTPVAIEYTPSDLNFIHKCIADPVMNAFVWRRLATQFPQQLHTAIGLIFELSNFNLSTDLDAILIKFNKYLEPDLPDLASVPIHLHELFQAAVRDVSKDKVKSKSLPKKGGFGTKS